MARFCGDDQKGICALSTIPMSSKTPLHKISIDRIDISKGHIKNNIQLVCRFMNLGRRHHSISEVNTILESIRSANITEKQHTTNFENTEITLKTIQPWESKAFLQKYHYLKILHILLPFDFYKNYQYIQKQFYTSLHFPPLILL